MEFVTIGNQKSFFGVTMTDFHPIEKIGSVMCCQDGDTFIGITLTGIDRMIPSGTPFFASGEPQSANGNWLINLDQPLHRWIVLDKKYVNANYTLKIDNAVNEDLSDTKPKGDQTIPSILDFKAARKNMINFRIISTELSREDIAKLQQKEVPKYINGAAYHYYLNQFMVRNSFHKSCPITNNYV